MINKSYIYKKKSVRPFTLVRNNVIGNKEISNVRLDVEKYKGGVF